jgi:hypothetical protein
VLLIRRLWISPGCTSPLRRTRPFRHAIIPCRLASRCLQVSIKWSSPEIVSLAVPVVALFCTWVLRSLLGGRCALEAVASGDGSCNAAFCRNAHLATLSRFRFYPCLNFFLCMVGLPKLHKFEVVVSSPPLAFNACCSNLFCSMV